MISVAVVHQWMKLQSVSTWNLASLLASAVSHIAFYGMGWIFACLATRTGRAYSYLSSRIVTGSTLSFTCGPRFCLFSVLTSLANNGFQAELSGTIWCSNGKPPFTYLSMRVVPNYIGTRKLFTNASTTRTRAFTLWTRSKTVTTMMTLWLVVMHNYGWPMVHKASSHSVCRTSFRIRLDPVAVSETCCTAYILRVNKPTEIEASQVCLLMTQMLPGSWAALTFVYSSGFLLLLLSILFIPVGISSRFGFCVKFSLPVLTCSGSLSSFSFFWLFLGFVLFSFRGEFYIPLCFHGLSSVEASRWLLKMETLNLNLSCPEGRWWGICSWSFFKAWQCTGKHELCVGSTCLHLIYRIVLYFLRSCQRISNKIRCSSSASYRLPTETVVFWNL